MTTGDGWKAAVRDRLAAGRLLPLGTAADGAWLTERAARDVLAGAASEVRGTVLGTLRLAATEEAGGPPEPPVRIAAQFAAVAGRPLPETAEEVRAALLAAAEGLGLVVAEVDLRVTELLEEAPTQEPAPPPPGRTSPATDDPVALAVLRVPGVAAVTDALGPPVRRTPGAVRAEFAVAGDRPALEVARAARTAAAAAAPPGTAVTVLVTEVRR
ncbi:hypothetical protein [Streptomyces sp. NPDC058486]|uniref:hypothetical protein n=1 Tax=unclassified Streptomyces TaxID=2593676 RepID=UPI00366684F3